MKLLRSLSGFLLLLVTTTTAFAQTDKGTLTGKIVDEKNEPAGYATVGAYNAKDSTLVRGTATTIDGDYSLENLAPGNYYIQSSMVGYEKIRSLPIQLAAGAKLPVPVIHLKKQLNQLKEVSISTTKPLIENQIDKMVMNVENSVLATGNTAMELLQKAPGVTVDKDGNISLRGKTGVLVMLDGKPTYLSQDQLANLLRATEANSIQSIEIMTNPSSKYDAAGNSGIINIKMKKNQNFGTNGTITIGGGYGRYLKFEPSISFNHREKLFNVFANYSFADRKNYNTLSINRQLPVGSDVTYFSSNSRNLNSHTNNNYKAGIDFFLGSKNTLGFIASGNVFRGQRHETGINRIGATTTVGDSAVVADNSGISPYDFSSYNINYKSTLDTTGKELTANLDYSRSSGKENSSYLSRYTNGALVDYRPSYSFRNQTPTVADIYSAKVDYTHPFSKKTKLETGLKSSYVKTDNNLIYDLGKTDGTYVNDPTRSNQFKYTEVITAGYISLNTEVFKDFTVQAGLRLENTHSEGNSITNASVVDRSYLNLFPTVFLKQKVSKSSTVGASYSRRIDRPDYGSLNPFVYYIDQYLYVQGNPYLNPQYTNAYELNYTLKDKYTASVNYSHTNGAITEVVLTNAANKALYQTNQNLATQSYLNLNVNAPVQIAKWWKTNNNLTVFFNRFKSPNLGGIPFSSGTGAWQANTNQSFTITKTTSAELNGSYNSKSVYGTFNFSPNYGVDLGISQSFADKKFNLKVGVNDVLNTRIKQTISSSLPTNTYTIGHTWESRVVRASLTWRFGNSNVKSVEKHGGSEAEQNRLNKK